MDHLHHVYDHRKPIDFDDMCGQPNASDFAATTLDKTRAPVARHYLRHWEASKTPCAETVHRTATATHPHHAGVADEAAVSQRPAALADSQRLAAGEALTLRASELMVLRIAHGRVWLTLTDVGPWSRVQAGDHFLSRGDSLTVLAGQELVMESFSTDPAASARFTWQAPGICISALQPAPAVNLRASIREPWLDLRHAVGLALGATGRLVRGLASGLGGASRAALSPMLTSFAMIFGADRACINCAGGTFDALKRDSGASCRS